MSNVLLDVSYLQSAIRCAQGSARSNEDLINFYRFLAEIISHKNVNIVLHKNGPVFETGQACKDFLLKESHGKFEINIVDPNKINYYKIIDDLSKSLSYINSSALLINNTFSHDLSPDFSYKNQSAIDFHEWLIKGKEKIPSFAKISEGGIYAPLILASRIGLYKNFENQNKKWNLNDSIALSSKLRTHIYLGISKSLNYNYLPSATRGYNSSIPFNDPTIRELLLGKTRTYGEFKKTLSDNENIISGVITRNNCIPIDAILDAFELREKTEELRKFLYYRPMLKSGDAFLSLKFKRLLELDKIKDEYLRNRKILFGIDAFNPAISASPTDTGIDFSLPIVTAVSKTAEYKRKKNLLKKMEILLIPILQAKMTNNRSSLRKLKSNVGLK